MVLFLEMTFFEGKQRNSRNFPMLLTFMLRFESITTNPVLPGGTERCDRLEQCQSLAEFSFWDFPRR